MVGPVGMEVLNLGSNIGHVMSASIDSLEVVETNSMAAAKVKQAATHQALLAQLTSTKYCISY